MNYIFRELRYIFIFGVTVCFVTLFLSSFGGGSDIYIETSVVTEKEEVNDGDSEASVDPFGYFNGKWNLWEYIGDSVSSFIQ